MVSYEDNKSSLITSKTSKGSSKALSMSFHIAQTIFLLVITTLVVVVLLKQKESVTVKTGEYTHDTISFNSQGFVNITSGGDVVHQTNSTSASAFTIDSSGGFVLNSAKSSKLTSDTGVVLTAGTDTDYSKLTMDFESGINASATGSVSLYSTKDVTGTDVAGRVIVTRNVVTTATNLKQTAQDSFLLNVTGGNGTISASNTLLMNSANNLKVSAYNTVINCLTGGTLTLNCVGSSTMSLITNSGNVSMTTTSGSMTFTTSGSNSNMIMNSAGNMTETVVNNLKIQSTGAGGSINITTASATAESLKLYASTGGIVLQSLYNNANAINIVANGGTLSKIKLYTSGATGANSIELSSASGGITLSPAAGYSTSITGYKKPVEVLTGSDTLTIDESGKLFILNSTTAFTVTLPTATSNGGVFYEFFVRTPPSSGAHKIGNSSTQIVGTVVTGADGTATDTSTGDDYIQFNNTTSYKGDYISVISDGTNWYARAQCQAAAGIAFS